MKNQIVSDLHKNRTVYVHALEVNDVYELQSIIEELVNEWYEQYTQSEILEFFNTVSIYALNEDNEDSIYSFDIEEHVLEIME